jgi:hypothetical protein
VVGKWPPNRLVGDFVRKCARLLPTDRNILNTFNHDTRKILKNISPRLNVIERNIGISVSPITAENAGVAEKPCRNFLPLTMLIMMGLGIEKKLEKGHTRCINGSSNTVFPTLYKFFVGIVIAVKI